MEDSEGVKKAKLEILEKQIERDYQRELLREAAKNVKRSTSSMKNVTFNVLEDLYMDFQARVTLDGFTVSQVLRAAVVSYTFGDLKVERDRLVSTEVHIPQNVSRDTEAEHKKPGRPPKEKSSEPKPNLASYNRDENGKVLLPEDWDHPNMTIDQYPIPKEPHIGLDARPHLTFDTVGPITGEPFGELCDKYYFIEVEKYDYEVWRGIKVYEYVARCALKFFLTNKLETVRYDANTLQPEVFAMLEAYDGMVRQQIAYKKEHADGAK